MIRAIVTGAGGRMGGRIISLISSDQDLKVTGAVEQKGHASVGRDVGEGLGFGKMGVVIDDDLIACSEKGDVVIDFTHHEASLRHLEFAVERGLAIVIGSTGFTAEEMTEARRRVQAQLRMPREVRRPA